MVLIEIDFATGESLVKDLTSVITQAWVMNG
jgi:hypothetical protein